MRLGCLLQQCDGTVEVVEASPHVVPDGEDVGENILEPMPQRGLLRGPHRLLGVVYRFLQHGEITADAEVDPQRRREAGPGQRGQPPVRTGVPHGAARVTDGLGEQRRVSVDLI